VLESAERARAALSDAGIPSIAFKGVALLQNGSYGDPAARGLGDSDLLIPEESADDAVQVLEATGFEPWVDWNPNRVGWLPAFTFADAQAPDGMPISLDLHWRTPYTSFRSGTGEKAGILWEGADLGAGLPAEEPHFVLLVEHFLKHIRVVAHVRGVGDLVRSLRRISDPELLASLADRRGRRCGLGLMLAFLRDRLGVQVPDEVLSAVGVPGEIPEAASRILDRSRLFGAEDPVSGGRVQGLRLQWALVGSPYASLRDAYDVVFPPRSWLALRYPEISSGWSRRRLHHTKTVAAWLTGRGTSPLSPNQEFET